MNSKNYFAVGLALVAISLLVNLSVAQVRMSGGKEIKTAIYQGETIEYVAGEILLKLRPSAMSIL